MGQEQRDRGVDEPGPVLPKVRVRSFFIGLQNRCGIGFDASRPRRVHRAGRLPDVACRLRKTRLFRPNRSRTIAAISKRLATKTYAPHYSSEGAIRPGARRVARRDRKAESQ